jgi:hypothetical protein
MRFWIIFCLLFTPALFAQDAKVIQLNPDDAKEAKAAYDEMKSAEKKWEDIQSKARKTYKGLDQGLEFSSDFKFIVPKQFTITTGSNYCCCTAIGAGTGTITIQ